MVTIDLARVLAAEQHRAAHQVDHMAAEEPGEPPCDASRADHYAIHLTIQSSVIAFVNCLVCIMLYCSLTVTWLFTRQFITVMNAPVGCLLIRPVVMRRNSTGLHTM